MLSKHFYWMIEWENSLDAATLRKHQEKMILVLFTQSCPTLCDPVDCSKPGFAVLHHLPEPAQTRVHWVSDTTQPSHPLSSSCPSAFNLSQHQGLFQWVGSLHCIRWWKYWSTFLYFVNILCMQNKIVSKGYNQMWKHTFVVLLLFNC